MFIQLKSKRVAIPLEIPCIIIYFFCSLFEMIGSFASSHINTISIAIISPFKIIIIFFYSRKLSLDYNKYCKYAKLSHTLARYLREFLFTYNFAYNVVKVSVSIILFYSVLLD